MKRIVILCDGTWNEPDAPYPTNVVRLAQGLLPEAPDGAPQLPIYLPGVGTGKGVTAFARLQDRVLGGLFGLGLYENVIEAYRHLVFLYEPGDQIFIFGFSRGAFTARSLTGFIRSTGIIERDTLHYLPEAVARYRVKNRKETHGPSSDESHAFRLRLSPRVATSQQEVEWRLARGLPPPTLLRIRFLGVWDSVGALGIPRHLSLVSWIGRSRFEFHDAELTSLVESARHAVALDERRRSFEPTLWENLPELNRAAGTPEPAYLEHHFPGDHGSVGGGGDLTHLSSIALSWMIEGADKAGLAFKPSFTRALADEHDPSGPLRNTQEAPTGLVNRLTRLCPKDRAGPADIADLHPSVLTRWALGQDHPYRPGSLARLETRIAARLAEADETRLA